MTRDVDFEIGAEVSPLKQKLREARDAVRQFADEGAAGVGSSWRRSDSHSARPSAIAAAATARASSISLARWWASRA